MLACHVRSHLESQPRCYIPPVIRLICCDVDGTLIGASGVVAPRVWQAAERARARGIHLAVCSGRPAFGNTRELAQRLGPGGWHVFQNGASIVHLGSGRSLSVPLREETVALLVERARRSGRVLELYTDDTYWVERDTPRARRHAELLGVPFGLGAFDEAPRGRIVRAQWLIDPVEFEALVAEGHPGLNVSPSTAPQMPDTLFVNLTSEGVDKGSAVRKVAAELGISLAEVMVVGDGLNDVGAMRIAGYPVAMANAEPEVHRVARQAVGHVDEGGVAEAFDQALAAE